MPSAIANTTHINIMKYMFYPPFRQPGRPCYLPGHHCKKRRAESPNALLSSCHCGRCYSFILVKAAKEAQKKPDDSPG